MFSSSWAAFALFFLNLCSTDTFFYPTGRDFTSTTHIDSFSQCEICLFQQLVSFSVSAWQSCLSRLRQIQTCCIPWLPPLPRCLERSTLHFFLLFSNATRGQKQFKLVYPNLPVFNKNVFVDKLDVACNRAIFYFSRFILTPCYVVTILMSRTKKVLYLQSYKKNLVSLPLPAYHRVIAIRVPLDVPTTHWIWNVKWLWLR